MKKAIWQKIVPDCDREEEVDGWRESVRRRAGGRQHSVSGGADKMRNAPKIAHVVFRSPERSNYSSDRAFFKIFPPPSRRARQVPFLQD